MRPFTLRTALERFYVSDLRVREISREFIVERGLLRSPYKPEFPPRLNPEDYLREISGLDPIDGVEIVEWMHISAAENMVLQARLAEYNRLGSQAVGNATDPRYPGLVVEDCRIKDDRGVEVRRRGYAIAITPRGEYHVPAEGKATGVFNDLITWSSVSATMSVQWTATLIKWKSLAETPITKTVGFYRDRRGNVAPNFFVQLPTRPKLVATVRMKLSSNRDQRVQINFRDPTNYMNVLGSRSVDVASGSSEITYTVSAFPYVPPVIAEIQPENSTDTKLEEYVVI